MALRLRIVSDHRRALGERSMVVFGVTGGKIGRSHDNDWVLPDPARFVSGHHARILFSLGTYYIEDTSTNGTYLNDSEGPLPKRVPAELHNGDIIRIGDIQVVVTIDQTAEATAERTANVGIDAALSAAEETELLSSATSERTAPDLNSSLSTSALFSSDADQNGLQVAGAFGQVMVVPFASSKVAAAVPVEDSNVRAARRFEQLARAVQKREKVSAGDEGVLRRGLEALCKGAGIAPGSLPQEESAAMLQLAGRLLREALVGLKDLEVKQNEVRQRFHLGPAGAGDNDPFRISTATDELLAQLLASHASRRADPAQWLRQCFEHVKRHQQGMAIASRTGFTEFLKQLDPLELEARFEPAGRRAPANGAGAWEKYREFFQSIIFTPDDDGVPPMYAEAYARAYKAANGQEDK